ncbi:hypothetical protein JGU71_11395 [Antrihabitans sp. YC3-6]|uniref:Uncharacterized protein n=1 Tax=Antrihabitans stalagmiti TaxID=2799499 RepID=A0A934NQC5_9NOCA|nr:hypothetical protein [Antrihabitans stalagmiti]MBJ8339491.1 hypothetical protein [Antrihabitans stalagmiti]
MKRTISMSCAGALAACAMAIGLTAGPAQAHGVTIDDTDSQGYLNYPGARCNYTNQAVTIARTDQSLIVVCITGANRYYYKGLRLSDGATIEIDDPTYESPGIWYAQNGETLYHFNQYEFYISNSSVGIIGYEPVLESRGLTRG